MNFKYVVALVLVLAVVSMAAKPNRRSRKEKNMKKKANKDPYKQCKPTEYTYTACSANKMTVTRTSTSAEEICKNIPTEEKECVEVMSTKILKKELFPDCNKTKTIDRSACATDDVALKETATYGVTTEWTGCKANRSFTKTFLCKTGEKQMGGKKNKKDKRGKANKGGNGKRVNRRRNKNKSVVCKYSRGGSWSDCDPDTNIKRREHPLKRGDPSACEPVKTVEKKCKRKKKNKKPNGCKYKKGQWGECDGTTNIKTMVKTLKRGDPNTCPPTQVIEKICKRQHKGLRTNCKYKKMGRWGTCDLATGVRSREVTLKKGDVKICPPKKTVTKPCKKIKNKKGKGKGCQYDKQPWSPCDAATNTVSRTLTLKDGDATRCNVTKLQMKKCKNKHLRPHVCKYRRTSWEECNPTTNMRVMVKTLKRGDPAQCEATQRIERKCKRKKRANVCKYKYEAWSECDISTNTMTRRQVLKSGPATCQSVKEYSKRCKKPCKFENGNWTECDSETNQMRRVDTLKKATDPSCPQTRVLTRKCGKNGKDKKCVYDHGTWSDCDTSENAVRTRKQKLISGGTSCKPEKITTKSCTKKNGEVRCFYGPWSEYDDCMNGVQKKRRQVIQGDQECETKSIKMKSC